MRSSSASSRLPYVVVLRVMPMVGPIEDYPQLNRKTLKKAIDECRMANRTWAQLIGAQYPGLAWFVVDSRDGTEHHPTQLSRGDNRDGQANPPTRTLW